MIAAMPWPPCSARPVGRSPSRHGGQWQRIAHDMDVQALWDAHRQCGVGVALRGSPSYPAKLSTDPQAPAVLFHRGDPTIADRYPTVAVVGTRSATRYGLGLAAQFGAELTASGVSVISGLSLGIDAAAHEGACGATGVTRTPVSASPVAAITPQHGPTPALPLAVVAGGLDSPCPRRHIGLWERVASCGAVVSEPPIGTGEQGWRFPQPQSHPRRPNSPSGPAQRASAGPREREVQWPKSGLFDDTLIATMKRGAYLIDTARAKICLRDAVVRALEWGQLAGYAGDVWFLQPAPRDDPWRTMPHHGMTPHISGSSLSAQARYAAGTWEILECFFEQRPIREEYLIVDRGRLAGAGAHSYSAGDATSGSDEAVRFRT